MKAFFASAFAFLVSAAAASVIQCQTDSRPFVVPRPVISEPFIITVADSVISTLKGTVAFVSSVDGRIALGSAGVIPFVARYDSNEMIIESASGQGLLWIVTDQKGAVVLQSSTPTPSSILRPFSIPYDDEVIFQGSTFPEGWTACPTASNDHFVFNLFYKNFADGCVAVKLVKSHTIDAFI